MNRIIPLDRSVIVACDVETTEQFETIAEAIAPVTKIGAMKLGFELGLGYGLPQIVETARRHTSLRLIYDHQKAGTDIPDTGKNFARVCKNAGIDAIILFPQAGPETQRAWTDACLEASLGVIVGGRMSHAAYTVSEGGYIADEGAIQIYKNAARAGIKDFVVPGNKPEVIRCIRELVEAEGISPVFYSPGFITQGGKLSEAAAVAGERFHAIIGRGITQAPDMGVAARKYCSQL
jgi:orotidine-5'-phosphate decarboxylase